MYPIEIEVVIIKNEYSKKEIQFVANNDEEDCKLLKEKSVYVCEAVLNLSMFNGQKGQ